MRRAAVLVGTSGALANKNKNNMMMDRPLTDDSSDALLAKFADRVLHNRRVDTLSVEAALKDSVEAMLDIGPSTRFNGWPAQW